MCKKFTLYLGLNDKDQKVQLIETSKAYDMVSFILLNKVEGATIFQAQGLYKHDDGQKVVENTFRIELLFTDEETVRSIVNTLKDVFNQESVAVQIEEINSELW